MLGLLVAVWRVASALRDARVEIQALKGQVSGLAKVEGPPAADPAPADPAGNAGDLDLITASIEALREEMERSQAENARNLESTVKAAEAGRIRQTIETARILHGLGTEADELRPLLVDLPIGEQKRLMDALKAAGSRPSPAPAETPAPLENEATSPDPEEVTPEPPGEEASPGVEASGDEGASSAGEEDPAKEDPEYREYTVRSGDTISGIARKHRVSSGDILEINGITDVRKIQIGQVLKIPQG